jgi:hypothetical protein
MVYLHLPKLPVPHLLTCGMIAPHGPQAVEAAYTNLT